MKGQQALGGTQRRLRLEVVVGDNPVKVRILLAAP